MDYKGQRLSEYIYSILTILFGGVAWIVGYVKGDFQVTFYGWAAGLALALLVGDVDKQIRLVWFLLVIMFLLLTAVHS